MSSNLDRIVNITIELQSVVSSGASFDHVLLVGPAPAKPLEDVTIPDVGVYTDLTAVNEMGWVSEGDSADPVGIAARIAFSQSVKPSKIYIAVQKKDSGGSDLRSPISPSVGPRARMGGIWPWPPASRRMTWKSWPSGRRQGRRCSAIPMQTRTTTPCRTLTTEPLASATATIPAPVTPISTSPWRSAFCPMRPGLKPG